MVVCQQFLVEYIHIIVHTNASGAPWRSDHEPLHTILSKISAIWMSNNFFANFQQFYSFNIDEGLFVWLLGEENPSSKTPETLSLVEI